MCGYKGDAVFMDADMLLLGDLAELFELGREQDAAVSVVKNKQRFEWPSMMYFNNEKCTRLTTTYINDENETPQSFDWADEVGELPPEWNFCVGYDEPTEELPKLVHYTMGIPHFAETRYWPYTQEWWEIYNHMTMNCSWIELMGRSVHAEKVLTQLQERANER